jgi:hypothetical protein
MRIGNSRSYLDRLGFPRCRFGPGPGDWQQWQQLTSFRCGPRSIHRPLTVSQQIFSSRRAGATIMVETAAILEIITLEHKEGLGKVTLLRKVSTLVPSVKSSEGQAKHPPRSVARHSGSINEVSRSSKDKPLSSLLNPNMEPEVDILRNTYRFSVAYDQDRPRSVRDFLTSRRIPIDATKSHVKARGGCIVASIRQFCHWRW